MQTLFTCFCFKTLNLKLFKAEMEMSEAREMEALKKMMMESGVEEEERNRILEEYRNNNASLKGKISAQRDRQVSTC